MSEISDTPNALLTDIKDDLIFEEMLVVHHTSAIRERAYFILEHLFVDS